MMSDTHVVTVALTSKAWASVEAAAAVKGMSLTDVINRAVVFYADVVSNEALADERHYVSDKDGRVYRLDGI